MNQERPDIDDCGFTERAAECEKSLATKEASL
jgi:hypothetical protein